MAEDAGTAGNSARCSHQQNCRKSNQCSAREARIGCKLRDGVHTLVLKLKTEISVRPLVPQEALQQAQHAHWHPLVGAAQNGAQ